MQQLADQFSPRSPNYSIRKLRDCIEQLAEVGFDARNATIEQFLVFLDVADRIMANGITTQHEIAKLRNRCKSGIQRNVKALTDLNFHKQPGYGLVEEFTDYRNLRLKPLRLTDKGLKAVLNLHESLSKGGTQIAKN